MKSFVHPTPFLSLLLLLALPGVMSGQTPPHYQDTLEVEIGKGAKVIFLARDAQDFEQIDRYDLNFLFDELWDQRQTGDLSTRSLNQKEAEALREGSLPEEKRKGLRFLGDRFYLNGFLGMGQSSSALYIYETPAIQLTDPEVTVTPTNISILGAQSRFSYGADVGMLLPLANRSRSNFYLRTGLGFESIRIQYRVSTSNGVQLQFGDDVDASDILAFNNSFWGSDLADSLTMDNQAIGFDVGFGTNFLYTQFIPTWQRKNKRGKNSWHLGLGLRVGVDLKDIGRPGPQNNNFVLLRNEEGIHRVRRTFQYAFVLQTGFDWIKFQASLLPHAYDLVSRRLPAFDNGESDTDTVRPMFSVGIRIGI